MTGSDPLIEQFNRRAEELARGQEQLREMFAEDKRHRARRAMWGLVGFFLAVYTAISLHDQHVRHCMILGQPDTAAERRICNLTIWGHDHEIGFDPALVERLRVALEEGGTP